MAAKKKAKAKKSSSGGKKRRSPAQKAAQRKAARAAHASAGGGHKKRRKSKGGKRHKKRRGGGGAMTRSNPIARGAPVMGFKQFAIGVLTVGGMATLGFVAGEMLRTYLLTPKADGTPSMLANFEQKQGTSPALQAVITGLPGLLGGGGAYWLGKKFNSPGLRTAGGALAIGGVVSGGSRLLFGSRFVAEKTGGVQLVRGTSAAMPGNQLMAPGTAAQQPGAGYGYTQPPAWRQLGDAFTGNPYGPPMGDQWTGNPYAPQGAMGDAFTANPGGSYVDRVGDRPRGASGFGITAAEELGE